MKVLYASPIFSDYRIPFYQKLDELFNGNFYVMYSPLRYQMEGLDYTLKKIPIQLNNIAYPYEDEKIFKLKKINNKDFENFYRIPYLKNFFKHLNRFNPDVFITEGFFQWTPAVVIYAWLHHRPVYISYERTSHTERNAPFFKILERKIIDKFVTGYLVNGTETTNYLKSLNINPNKIYIAGMNADSEGLKKGIQSITDVAKNNLKEEFGLTNKGLTYLFSGQFIPRKGIKYLLSSWLNHIKKHPNDHLILIGAGELFDTFNNIYKIESSIHFTGKVPYDEIYKYYAISDIFVIPTLEDNWCLVVPEAMSCGMPIACSKYNGGATDLIKENENGIIFDPLIKESIENALNYFHGKDLVKMGNRSKELEEPFNTENCAKRVFQAITNKYDKKMIHINNY